jgi:hypothetical protein
MKQTEFFSHFLNASKSGAQYVKKNEEKEEADKSDGE